MKPGLKEIVRQGYDQVSRVYRPDTDGGAYPKPYSAWIEGLALDDDAAVLELGCGCGVPVARLLAGRTRYVGVDLSPVQIARAQELVPAGTFECADMDKVTRPDDSLDAVIALYSIIHLPLEEQPKLFDNIAGWLRPGGRLLISVGVEAYTGQERDWMDVPGALMAWDHADADTYRRWLTERGFTITHDEHVAEGDTGHQLLRAEWRGTATHCDLASGG